MADDLAGAIIIFNDCLSLKASTSYGSFNVILLYCYDYLTY